MVSKNEDDFWNTSASSGFNFDDDEDSNQPFKEFVFSSTSEENSILPIHSLISKASLDLILDDIKSTNDYIVPPVEETIKKMFNGQKYVLEVYKKLTDKLLLLDSAVNSMDGNVILGVVLFLKSTLRRNIFYHQLAKRTVAVRHYATHLIVNGQYEELADLYMVTGNNSGMRQVYYLSGRDIKNKDTLYKKLEHVMLEHLQKVSNDEKRELNENMQLLQWQIDRKETCNSVIEQLASLCKKEWERNKNSNDAIMDFKEKLKIDDFAFEWTAMNVLASMQSWPQLTALFMKSNWLSKKSSLKTVMPAEIFVYGISRHSPPKDALEQYLHCISDHDRALYLAEKLNCHKFVIHHFINQRDRQALLAYKAKVVPQNEEYFLIENALQSSDKKWKN
ncbi:vacuolar protein sorting 16B [Leptinotarsa decemlineata]|uniref:vacuolar protein sorting 16B n=1 Tax=Leptinotarsa decemlineata TaxID=7539 RepID=UPI003D30C00D